MIMNRGMSMKYIIRIYAINLICKLIHVGTDILLYKFLIYNQKDS